MKIKKRDFIELDFIGRVKENNQIFDLTEEKVAKENDLYNEKQKYGPLKICVGEKQVVKGLDEFLEGKETGKNYTISLKPEEAFGKKNPKLMQLIPLRSFKKHNIKPQVGLQINMDGMMGIVRSVSGGRVIIDLNHPLAGKEVTYEIKIKRVMTDVKEKIQTILDLVMPGLKHEVKDNKLTILLLLFVLMFPFFT